MAEQKPRSLLLRGLSASCRCEALTKLIAGADDTPGTVARILARLIHPPFPMGRADFGKSVGFFRLPMAMAQKIRHDKSLAVF